MTDPISGTPDYTMGYGEAIVQLFRRYTATANASYLLPYLRPGLRVLDFGCGPGSISVGLAEAIAPGELHGIDIEQSQIDLATSAAEAGGHCNTVFRLGDVTSLDFEDGFFDVAHCHNVLMHVPDTASALTEVKRVLKPGGIIGCREMICRSGFTHPDSGAVQKAWEMFEDLLTADEGHPQMGKDLKTHVLNAGFTDVQATASFDVYSSPDDVEFIYRLADTWLLSSEITGAAIQYGAATRHLCEELRFSSELWREHPGALVGVAFGEVVATKPAT